MWEQIALAAIVTGLVLVVQHYWLRNHRLHVLKRYVLGNLAILLPVSAVLALWGSWMELALIWASTVLGGFLVMASYWRDRDIARSAHMDALGQEGTRLREVLDGTTRAE